MTVPVFADEQLLNELLNRLCASNELVARRSFGETAIMYFRKNSKDYTVHLLSIYDVGTGMLPAYRCNICFAGMRLVFLRDESWQVVHGDDHVLTLAALTLL